MDNNNLLTIAIPTYKRPQFLQQAIDSAVHQQKSGIRYNVIVVNNDPETDLTELEQLYRNAPVDVRFYTNERNLGMLGNVNRCVELAEGKWISFLHDDDLLLPNYIHEISKYLEDDDTACLIPRRYLLFDGNGRQALEKKRRIKHAMLGLFPGRHLHRKDAYPIRAEDNVFAWQNCYGAPSCGVVFNKEKIKASGLFFPEGTYSWDFYSFLKLNYQHNVKIVDAVLSVYRMSVGLSLRPEVQLDFYKAFEQVKEHITELSAQCANYIRKYGREMSYLDACILDEDGQKLARENGFDLVEEKSSRFKHIWFMLRRLHYVSVHHLDVEVPLTKDGKIILMHMGIMKEKDRVEVS